MRDYELRCAAEWRRLRVQADLTVEQCVARANRLSLTRDRYREGLSTKTWYSWENGTRVPPLGVLPILACVLGLDHPADLLVSVGRKKTTKPPKVKRGSR